jgi:hypothetical protein
MDFCEGVALSSYSFNNECLIAQPSINKETSLDFCDKGLKEYRISIQYFRIELNPYPQRPNLKRPQQHQDHIKGDDDKERGDPA